MSHEIFDRLEPASGSSDRSFGLVFCGVFLLIAFAPTLSGRTIRWWALLPGGAFLLAALVRPALLSGLNRGWTKTGLLLHRLVSPVILAIFFYAVLTPFACVMRRVRPDAVRLSREPAAGSYWIDATTAENAKKSMTNQF